MLRILGFVALMSIQVFSSSGSATANIKLRSQASATSEAVGSVTQGSSFEVLSQEGDFYWVNSNGQEGFVAAKFVKVKSPGVWERSSPMGKFKIILAMAYLFFGLIVGQMMTRSYMMRYFNSLSFISVDTGKIGEGIIAQFIYFLEKRVLWEVFMAVVSIIVGSTMGWIYILFRVIKARKPGVALESA